MHTGDLDRAKQHELDETLVGVVAVKDACDGLAVTVRAAQLRALLEQRTQQRAILQQKLNISGVSTDDTKPCIAFID